MTCSWTCSHSWETLLLYFPSPGATKLNLGDTSAFYSSFKEASPYVLYFTCSPHFIPSSTWLLTLCLFWHSCLPCVFDGGICPSHTELLEFSEDSLHTSPPYPPYVSDLSLTWRIDHIWLSLSSQGPHAVRSDSSPILLMPVPCPKRGLRWVEKTGRGER